MDNIKLLKQYRRKLSFFFACFVMFSLYAIQTIFLFAGFVNNNLDLRAFLEKRLSGIENILKNSHEYYTQIQSNDFTLQKIIYKTLENSVIYKNDQKVLAFAVIGEKWKNYRGIVNTPTQKYLVSSLLVGKDKYIIILFVDNMYTFEYLLKQLFVYGFILLPFFFFFYFIGYFLVGKTFKVIEQTIESLEDFTGHVNHEMKTPLAEMISTLELAKKIGNYEQANTVTLQSAYRLSKILDSIVGIADLGNISYKKEKIHVLSVVESIIDGESTNIQAKKMVIHLDISRLSFLKVNKEHFVLCIQNLLSNAIKYSHQNGNIILSFHQNIFRIEDEGIGIDKANLKNIFQRYFRESYTNESGWGLGLALVKKICDLNHWNLQIESEKNKCTKISINFS